jgi:hypothetical protein
MCVVHVHRIAGIGGSERHLLTLLPALANRGLDVRFVGLDASGEMESFHREVAVPFARLRSPARLHRRCGEPTSCTRLVNADVFGVIAAGRARVVSTKHNDDRFRLGPYRFLERCPFRPSQASPSGPKPDSEPDEAPAAAAAARSRDEKSGV